MPFIKSEVASFINRAPQEGVDDELIIGMIAFHEAIEKYDLEKGNFLSFASILIRNRLIDFTRKEKRHRGNISLYEEVGEDGEIIDIIKGEEIHEEDIIYRDATKAEIAELSRQMEDFGVSFMDVAENSPKQDRTLETCREVIRYAYENKELMEKFLKSKKLPIMELEKGSKMSKKTIERHRKYLVVECHPSIVVFLDQKGRFFKAANLNYEVGEIVEKPVLMDTDNSTLSERYEEETIKIPREFIKEDNVFDINERRQLKKGKEKKKPNRILKNIALIAAVFAIVFGITQINRDTLDTEVFVSMEMRINPAVNIDVNREGKVIEVKGLNGDGERV